MFSHVGSFFLFAVVIDTSCWHLQPESGEGPMPGYQAKFGI